MPANQNMDKTKKILLTVIVISAALIVILLAAVLLAGSSEEGGKSSINIEEIKGSEDSSDVVDKIENPDEYTWEDFEKLDPEEQSNFIGSFENPESFDEWLMENGEGEVILYLWDVEGRLPSEYTWEEYENLNEVEKAAFRESFLTEEEFEFWKNSVYGAGERPWEEEEKDVSEYTWEEFDALTPAQQEEFLSSFETPEALEEWLNNVGDQ